MQESFDFKTFICDGNSSHDLHSASLNAIMIAITGILHKAFPTSFKLV